jgi:hypothetical protein
MGVAALLGYLLAQPLDIGGFTLIAGLLLVLSIPLLIRYHYPLMLLAWNMGAVVFFLPGHMPLWIVAVGISFMISFTHKILDEHVHFVSVPQLTAPFLALGAVVIVTAELRGGFGLRSMGGETVGGRRYVEILMAILGYFALTAREIPFERAYRWLGLFQLSGAVTAVSILYGHISSLFNFIFLFLPVMMIDGVGDSFGPDSSSTLAYRPLAGAGGVVFGFILARYGIRQMMAPGRKWVFVIFCAVSLATMFSGSRLALVSMAMIFGIQFWLEGLFRTRLFLFFTLFFVLLASFTVVFAAKLPLSMQRALTVLPVQVDPVVRANAEGSSEWRREIWQVVVPQIPQYLLLGKGYVISGADYSFITDSAFTAWRADDLAATIAGDYHNGPLSVIVPFGIWGAIAFLWVLAAGLRVLWRNYRHGRAELRVVNTYLLSAYIVVVVTFMFVFGSFYSGFVGIAGLLGFAVALNGGVAGPRVEESRSSVVGMDM